MPYEDLTGTVVQKICMACSREFKGSIGQCPHDGNMLVALPADQWLEKRLDGKYVIKRKLGTGGMGEVYLAWHELMQAWVAIKFLKSSFVEEESAVRRFQQEAQAATRLKHPNVINLYDFSIAPNGQPYMVMEYLVGTDADNQAISLAQLLKQKKETKKPFSVDHVIHIIAQACDALDHAHRKGVIHRDIKPANIMIVPNEQDKLFVKVVDFGVAKLLPINNNVEAEAQSITTFGEVCGSPVYMSPEQCSGQSLNALADIYSMGVVLYEVITGQVPLIGRNMVETMQKHMEERPKRIREVRPDIFVPEKLEQVVMRALEKAPHLRQQSMAELAQDLRFSMPKAGQQSATLKAFVPLPPEEEKPSMPWLWPAVAGALVTSVAAGMFFMYSQKPPAPKATTAVPITAPPTGTTAGTSPETSLQPTGTTTNTTVHKDVNPMVSPSSAGSPATTGGITATINTNTHKTSIANDQPEESPRPRPKVRAVRREATVTHVSKHPTPEPRTTPEGRLNWKAKSVQDRFASLTKMKSNGSEH